VSLTLYQNNVRLSIPKDLYHEVKESLSSLQMDEDGWFLLTSNDNSRYFFKRLKNRDAISMQRTYIPRTKTLPGSSIEEDDPNFTIIVSLSDIDYLINLF
jgi:hypothetical protein